MAKSFPICQRVSTCLQVFCDETLSALKVHPDLENNDGTVKLTAKFIEFWKIVDVHIPFAGMFERFELRCHSYYKLIHMSNFAKEIANKSSKRVESLRKDTGNCLSKTCNG